MNELTLIQKIAVWAIPVIFAITVHEVAHGWVASKFGDQSARMLGRLTLNPIKHIDPIGTIVVPLALLMLGGFIFGWAKPVPVNARNFKRPRHDMAWVAMAGPLSNFIMAILWAIIIKIGIATQGSAPEIGQFLVYSGLAGVSINLILLVLNLLPIPPLDGSHVVSALLSPRLAWQYNRIAPFGFIILVVMMVMGLLTPILIGPYTFIQQFIYSVVGLH
ncbi:site-2 protease family protein [Thiomicrorhabdus sp. ZW0627]|uniref:site-2 protease family protein n=1 Tax=Thiomicrorhabdus sp. ZW0627 TaxID=3039774 RepID=UPI00243645B8|nr:site-2 protease family protein [Thiomicrorhabdus sp. ZW0627]MDG6772945.1 site-2 protease family protein [Thiomicrorhabdus sp. ZW0627]